ncbi:MAG: aminotransferase class V-fold PLP-dependent enzyme, partial [Clostridia bacterium]|nr:aminotransferase class V-fold PLP-dependent enzyme [Clostridia bacterium]
MIYLDNAATSFFKPKQVIDATMEAVNKYTANAGRGAYKVAQETSMKILDCRDKCVKLFGEEFECIFTPGCSYSLNLAILGTVKRNSHIITTYLEHNSVLRVLEMLKINGIIDYTVLTDFSKQNIEKYIKPNTTTIITTHVSNVTGEEIDLNLFSQICKEHGLIYIVDSAQGAGHCDADYSVADIVAFAGHKGLRSLMGVGGLMVKHHIKLKPIIFGGTGLKSKELVQPNDVPEGFEVGSLNAISIISLEAGIDNFLKNKKTIIEKEEKLTQYLIKKLKGLKFIKCYSKIEKCKG